MARVITRLLHETIAPRADRDKLTPTHLRGALKLSVSRPARVYINGVDRGVWPDPRPLEVPAGDYHIHAVPLDLSGSRPAHPVTYTKIQVVSGRLTQFRIDLE